MKRMQHISLSQKRVIIREDLNVPLKDGRISDDSRLIAALPTIKSALAQGARVAILSHLGRPEEGKFDPEFSLQPIADYLSRALHQPVRCLKSWLDGFEVAPGECVVCENVRFNPGENKNDPILAKRMAALCDVFVMDAFATAHRAQASTVGIAEFAPIACAGPLLCAEIDALQKALAHPEHPTIALVGGAKVSTKLKLLDNIIDKVDHLIVGGGIANTFLKAKGFAIGKSLYEPSCVSIAEKLLNRHAELPLPTDVVVATECSPTATAQIKMLSEINDNDMILDIGPQTAAEYSRLLRQAKTILWNGPVGVFEIEAFASGTREIARAIAASPAFSIAGGGDTVAAIHQMHCSDDISYISTGGGAFLEFLEGATLPAIEVLEKRAQG